MYAKQRIVMDISPPYEFFSAEELRWQAATGAGEVFPESVPYSLFFEIVTDKY